MENENLQKEVDNNLYKFLYDTWAKEIFGRIDFALKSGIHIQYMHPDQEDEFRFINKYSSSLKNFYKDFFGVILEIGGEETETYYYLDFEGGKRGAIPIAQRYFLTEEHLIIGIFACKVYAIDFNSEESSLTTFKKLMAEEYEEYKEDFYRLLAQSKSSLYTGDDVYELDKSVNSAFKYFNKLGWVYFKNDEQFTIMPSFERLRKLYADEINNIQKLTQNYKFVRTQ